MLALVSGAIAILAIGEFLKLVTPYGVELLTIATYSFVAIFFYSSRVISTNQTPLIEATAMVYG